MGRRIVAPVICTYALVAVVFHAYWGFIVKDTIFANTLLTYLVFLMPLLLLFVTFAISKRKNVSLLMLIWTPFLLWRFGGMIVNSSFEISSPWLVALILMLIASEVDIMPRIPYNFMVLSGLIVAVGIIIEIAVPSFYFSTIYPMFYFEGTFDSQTMYEDGYGCSGFMNQLDRAAMPMIFAEGILLYIHIPDCDHKHYGLYRSLKILALILLIICVFLTGKRMASLVAVIAPFAAYYFSQPNSQNRVKILLFGVLGAILAYLVYTIFFDFFSESMGIGRLMGTLSDRGSDINAERSWRWKDAIVFYHRSPIFGCGVNYIENSGRLAVHNYYLQILAEQGLVGLFAFIVPLVSTLLSCTSSIKRTKNDDDKKSLTYALFCILTIMLCMITENGDIFMIPILFMAISMVISGVEGRRVDLKKSYSSAVWD